MAAGVHWLPLKMSASLGAGGLAGGGRGRWGVAGVAAGGPGGARAGGGGGGWGGGGGGGREVAVWARRGRVMSPGREGVGGRVAGDQAVPLQVRTWLVVGAVEAMGRP